MKKLQILILCTVIGLAGVLLVNAKDLTNMKPSVSNNENLNNITDVYRELNKDNPTGDENSVGKKTCDINLDVTTRDYAEQLINNCLLTDNRDLDKCDINEDGEKDIADITYFIDLCVLKMPIIEDLPTYRLNSSNNKENINKKNLLNNGKMITTGYMVRTGMDSLTGTIETGDDNNGKIICDNDYAEQLINNCLLTDNRDMEKCDIDGDGDADIHDITAVIDECLMLAETGTVNNEETYSQNFCDINSDNEISIADINRFNSNCSVVNGTNDPKCDVNKDGEFDIADINIFNYTCKNEILGINTDDDTNTDNGSIYSDTYLPKNSELKDAFDFAHNNGMTSANSIDDAKMSKPLTRGAMAKILSNYAKNVLGLKEDSTKDCNFSDVSKELDAQYDNGITSACKLGLMGKNTTKFNPSKYVTRGQFSTVLSRMISGIEDGSGDKKYYEPHMDELCKNGIIKKCNKNPEDEITRGNAFTMFMRAYQ